MEPLKAPKRVQPERPKADNSALWWIVALALCGAAAIAWQQLGPTSYVAATQDQSVADADGFGPGAGAAQGARKVMKEEPLQMAKPLPREGFAGPVTHVTDSAKCRALRAERGKVEQAMGKPHSKAQATEFQLDLRSIRNAGTELGCWSGGTG